MSITPAHVLNSRAVPVTAGQLDLFAGDTEPLAGPGRVDRTVDTDDRCPADCPCYWMTADTDDRSTTDTEGIDL